VGNRVHREPMQGRELGRLPEPDVHRLTLRAAIVRAPLGARASAAGARK
jgi:hypothetical protein